MSPRSPNAVLRSPRPVVALLLALAGLLTARPVHVVAQEAAGPDPSSGRSVLDVLIGTRPERPRIIPGVWALHPFEPQFPELDWTRGVGVQIDQWVAATFINSYDERAFVVALERYWWRSGGAPAAVGVGYRAGLVTGYDERLFELARHTPVLPFGGLLVWAQLGPLSLDAFYAYRGITVEAAIGLSALR